MDEPQRALEHANLVIRAGKAYEAMDERCRAATLEFAEDLRRWGLTVKAEITEYIRGRRGLGPIEWTALALGGSAAKRLADNLVDERYAAGKEFLSERLRKGSGRRKLGFKIYGPDSEVLKEWTTEEDDPEENKPE